MERQYASQDPDEFWKDKAKLIEWMRGFEEVYRFGENGKHEWFVGGKLNATVNCIDRHVFGDRRLKAALIWVGEDGEEHTYTYNRLYREVKRFANALKKLGVAQPHPGNSFPLHRRTDSWRSRPPCLPAVRC